MRLPITITVREGGVTVDHPTGVQAMSKFSNRAQRLALDFGIGTHTIDTEQDWDDIPTHTQADILGEEQP